MSGVFLVEALPGDCSGAYESMINFYVCGKATNTKSAQPVLTKQNLKDVLTIAQSDRERLLIKYSVYKASGLSPTAARRYYGFDNICQRAEKLEHAVQQIKQIRTSVLELAMDREKAIAHSLGVLSDSSDSSSDDQLTESSLTPSRVDFCATW